MLFLITLYLFQTTSPVYAQEDSTQTDYDLNGKKVTFYPEPLMISRKAIVFYGNTKLLNLFIDLRTPTVGRDFAINNTCSKTEAFSAQKNCHVSNFLEFLSKFSLEVTRTFSTLFRFIEINDILHQTHKLPNKQLVGFDDLPSFLATEIQLCLKTVPSLHATADTLDAGFPLLIEPLVDYQYQPSKSLGVIILYTVPELHNDRTICTIEYLLPLKYNVSGICYHGPIIRDELALLRCQNSEYILKKSLLDKSFHSSTTFVCPQHILQLVNNTDWLGLPWHRNTKLNFARQHQKAQDCTNLHELFHLGGRFYLSTQQGILKFTIPPIALRR